jgi:hypothetical protein
MLSEIHRLEDAGVIKEIKEATWVANPVLVPKKNTDVLRMCVDFTCLNKHCPKDNFPLPRIDQIIDSTAGCERLSFLDAYSGYIQICLKEDHRNTRGLEENKKHTNMLLLYMTLAIRFTIHMTRHIQTSYFGSESSTRRR